MPSSTTRYAEIAEAIADEIRAGRPPVGESLEAETALAERFGASRHTLRHALGLLEDRGLILRRRGSGTCVIARESPRSFVQSVNSITELLRYPGSTYRQNLVVETITVAAEQVALLRVPEGSSWLHIGALRRERDRGLPVAWTDIYVAPQYAGVVRRPEHERSMVFEQIERHYGVAIERADVEIFAEALSGSHAAALGLDAGTPALVIVRRYFDAAGQVFEITVTRHPEHRFVFAMSLNRNNARS